MSLGGNYKSMAGGDMDLDGYLGAGEEPDNETRECQNVKRVGDSSIIIS